MSAFDSASTTSAVACNNNTFAVGDQLLAYNVHHQCRYHQDQVISDEERMRLSEQEIAFVHDYLYQEDLLQIFQMEDRGKLDYDLFIVELDKLYQLIKDYAPFHQCMTMAAGALLSEDQDVGLLMLYAFDYLHHTHKCVADFLKTGAMKQQDVLELQRALLANR